MTVEEFIEELKKFNPKAEMLTIRSINTNEWERTKDPKIETIKNDFGEWVLVK